MVGYGGVLIYLIYNMYAVDLVLMNLANFNFKNLMENKNENFNNKTWRI
jgi:hypothetical protein